MSIIPDFFDKYERVARVYPALVVGSPALLAVALTLPTRPAPTITGNAVAVAVLLAFLYALTHLVRAAGRKAERSLWAGWGGPPSTRMMLWTDTTMTDQWQETAHGVVLAALSVMLPSKRKEPHNPEEAKKLIGDAFAHVKTILDLEKPDGKH